MSHFRFLGGRIVAAATTSVVLAAHAGAQVSGTVHDAATMAPLPGVLVGVQATTQKATTGPDGAFTIPGVSGGSLVVVGAKKGYYNDSLMTGAPVSGLMLLLSAVPPSEHADYDFVEPDTCAVCHPEQVSQWTGSAMAKAGTNTWVYDIYDGTGTPGGMGGFVYQRDSRFKDFNPESECASCHQPEPWVKAPHTGLEDLGSLSAEALHGVSCEVCHKIADVDESKVNFPGIYPGAVDFRRPTPADGQVQYGVLGDTSFQLFGLMRPSYQPQLRAAVCAVCHQDKNDHDGDGDFEDPGGVISEPTYLEWLNSPYADPTFPRAADCVDCHMPAYGSEFASNHPAAVQRDPSTIRHHRIAGTTARYLENAASLTIACEVYDGELHVDVDVTNTGTGHHVPTGVTVRNVILLVEAERASDGLRLPFTGDQVVHDLGGIGSPTQGYYAGQPGKLFAKVNHDATGQGPTFFTDATGIQFDTRIPALATDQTHYTFRAPTGSGPLNVRVRLIYRRAFRAFVDAKQWTQDGHGNPLADIAPPHFGHLMEEATSVWTPGP